MSGAALLFSFGVTPVELAAMLALQPQLTASAIDGAAITGLLTFAVVSLALLAFFGSSPPLSRRHGPGHARL